MTIYALATPLGKSGVAVIRISGRHAKRACEVFGASLPAPRQAGLRLLKDPASGVVFEQALLLWFPSPGSVTGEDVLEIHCHGSKAVIKKILHVLGAIEGLRMAEPGEFMRRAFVNGKLDLIQIEGLSDIIEAETEMQLQQAVRQALGDLTHLYGGWRKQIVKLLSLAEAYIDFPDEEIPEAILADMMAEMEKIRQVIEAHLAEGNRGERLRQGVEIAIVGPPNVGKSTLMNYLARRPVAITSAQAGTTRDVVESTLDMWGYPVVLADTAGIRDTVDAIESEGIRRARERAENANLTIAVIDTATPPEVVADWLGYDIVLVNKVDMGCPPLPVSELLPVSVQTGEGMAAFEVKLKNLLEQKFGSKASHPPLTRARYRKGLKRCLENLEKAQKEKELECLCENIRLAAMEIGRLTGNIHVEEVLDNIFSAFCIGK